MMSYELPGFDEGYSDCGNAPVSMPQTFIVLGVQGAK